MQVVFSNNQLFEIVNDMNVSFVPTVLPSNFYSTHPYSGLNKCPILTDLLRDQISLKDGSKDIMMHILNHYLIPSLKTSIHKAIHSTLQEFEENFKKTKKIHNVIDIER